MIKHFFSSFPILPVMNYHKLAGSLFLIGTQLWSNPSIKTGNLQEKIKLELASQVFTQSLKDKVIEYPYTDFERGIQQLLSDRYQDAIDSLQQFLDQQNEVGNLSITVEAFIAIGTAHHRLSNFQEALAAFETALGIIKTENPQVLQSFDLSLESNILSAIGQTYYQLSDYPAALEHYDQSLKILQTLNTQSFLLEESRVVQARTLHYIAEVLRQQGHYLAAMTKAESALEIAQELERSVLSSRIMDNLGAIHYLLGQYDEALKLYEASLTSVQVANDPYIEARVLRNTGIYYIGQGQYNQALEYFQQSLNLTQKIGDRLGEARTTKTIGLVFSQRGDYVQAIEQYEQALEIHRSVGDRISEGQTLQDLGSVHQNLGNYAHALDLLKQALQIQHDIGDRPGLANSFMISGSVYHSKGQYSTAQENLENAVAIFKEIGHRSGEGASLNDLASVYYSLGEWQAALNLYQKAFEIRHDIGEQYGMGVSLNNIGLSYSQLGQPSEALVFFQQALAIRRSIGDRAGIASTLSNIGLIYQQQSEYAQALNAMEHSLVIRQEIGNRLGEATVLNNIALVYEQQKQHSNALETYQEALGIFQDIGNAAGEQLTLSNIGYLLEQQGDIELAVVFYKDSVRVAEQIRSGLKDFSLEQQQTYIETVADTYRRLANLLLSQGRMLEAQQVLELLKVQELLEYTDDERTSRDLPEVILLPKEAEIIAEYKTLITFGQQLRACEATRCANLSNLRTQRDEQFRQYREAVSNLRGFIQQRIGDGENIELLLQPTEFAIKAKEIIDQQPGTVVIYPLVLDEKLWLLWAADGRIISRHEIAVSLSELGNTIIKFRALLEDRYSNPEEIKIYGQKLYNWLIVSIEDELSADQNIKHLVFSPDRITRYLPMGVLYDGEQYLIEKYTVTTILSAALTDVNQRSPIGTEGVSILGAGVSQKFEGFNPLTYVPIELDTIIRDEEDSTDSQGLYFGRQLLDPDFTFTALRDALGGRQFLHIATHGEFVPGHRDKSYLLMGDGEKLPIPEIETLGTYLEDVHLAVLSACQTALGGPDEEGLEIAGLGYYFLKSQVDAVMASLWNVNDSSTSQLMQTFYQTLSTGTETNPVTKAEALRTAQLALLNGNEPNRSDIQRFTLKPQTPEDQPRPESGLAHPYYWAPFILMGNGL